MKDWGNIVFCVSRWCFVKNPLWYTHVESHCTDITSYIICHITDHDWKIEYHQINFFMMAQRSLHDCSIPQKALFVHASASRNLELGCPSWPLVRSWTMTNNFDDNLGSPVIYETPTSINICKVVRPNCKLVKYVSYTDDIYCLNMFDPFCFCHNHSLFFALSYLLTYEYATVPLKQMSGHWTPDT